MGRDFENNENSLIYMTGVDSHYRLPIERDWALALGNTLTLAGFDPDDGKRPVAGDCGCRPGSETAVAIRDFRREDSFATSLIYYRYWDNPSFEQATSDRGASVKRSRSAPRSTSTSPSFWVWSSSDSGSGTVTATTSRASGSSHASRFDSPWIQSQARARSSKIRRGYLVASLMR